MSQERVGRIVFWEFWGPVGWEEFGDVLFDFLLFFHEFLFHPFLSEEGVFAMATLATTTDDGVLFLAWGCPVLGFGVDDWDMRTLTLGTSGHGLSPS